jgi:hypothetical protein
MFENTDLLSTFLPAIRDLSDRDELKKEDILVPDFLLGEERNVERNVQVYYAPFHYVNEGARLVLVGITPGWRQVQIIFRDTRRHVRQGSPPEEASRRAAQEACFAGEIRDNIISMLDELGVLRRLGVPPAELFAPQHAHLLHMTSAVRYPVFKDGQNYSGGKPRIIESLLLQGYGQTWLKSEFRRLRHLRHALIVPFGKSVWAALEKLFVRQRILTVEQCLDGFPHPSANNRQHRLQQFDEHKARLASKVAVWFEDAERQP